MSVIWYLVQVSPIVSTPLVVSCVNAKKDTISYQVVMKAVVCNLKEPSVKILMSVPEMNLADHLQTALTRREVSFVYVLKGFVEMVSTLAQILMSVLTQHPTPVMKLQPVSTTQETIPVTALLGLQKTESPALSLLGSSQVK